MKRTILMIGLVFSVFGCTKASESNDAKRTPKPPPSATMSPPSGSLSIAIEIDGAPSAPLDSARLAAVHPDFTNDEHRAWKLTSLLPNTDRPGMVFAVTGDQDITIVLHSPSTKTDPIPVVTLNRRGELFASVVTADDPFPAYHGQGGRLARPGDPSTRISNVKKIRAYVESDASASK